MTEPIKKGDQVALHYQGTFDDGIVFDSSESSGRPLIFKVGAGQVIPGFEKAVLGMKKGEEKTFRVTPAEAYGEHNPDLLKEVPRGTLPKEADIKVGMMLGMKLSTGATLPVKVVKVTTDKVTMDVNHPLAGKALNFKIRIVEVFSQ